jgi:hypothetical protein
MFLRIKITVKANPVLARYFKVTRTYLIYLVHTKIVVNNVQLNHNSGTKLVRIENNHLGELWHNTSMGKMLLSNES